MIPKVKFSLVVFVTIALASCSQTKYIYYTGKPVLQSGNRMLITEISGFTEIRSSELAERTREKLIDDLFTVYLPAEEYKLLSEGVAYDSLRADKLSTETKMKIQDILNLRYLLEVKLLNAKNGDSYGSYTSNELNRYQEPYNRNSETNTASILFTITDMKQLADPRSFTVKVSISPLSLPDQEGGEERINVSNSEAARYKAYSKGIKEIKKYVF